MSRIVLMGSGETAPTMVRLHRRILAECGEGAAVMLDTPFGFQTNADDLVAKTRGYFADSVGRPVEVATWRRRDAPVVEQERSLALLHAARWAFAGPGSPSYALRQWTNTPVPDALADVVGRGGTLCLGSAAAVLAGARALPVYEIYKAGADPSWLDGLDLLGRLAGVSAAVVPHYDNNEGGHYDTRCCYIGEARLGLLERELPAGTGIVGIDEHTAVIVDLPTRTVEVVGTGGLTLRSAAGSQRFTDGTVLSLDDLTAALAGIAAARSDAVATQLQRTDETAASATSTLRAVADEFVAGFEAAISARDAEAAIEAVLGLEQALRDWSADTQQGDDDYARRALRALVVRLGEAAVAGTRDPRDVVGPYVELLLELRGRARTGKDFATSDLVRDRLAAIGVEVRDAPDGPTWGFA